MNRTLVATGAGILAAFVSLVVLISMMKHGPADDRAMYVLIFCGGGLPGLGVALMVFGLIPKTRA